MLWQFYVLNGDISVTAPDDAGSVEACSIAGKGRVPEGSSILTDHKLIDLLKPKAEGF